MKLGIEDSEFKLRQRSKY